VRAGLAIIEQVSGVGSQKVEYAFKHPLPQEVAHRSQLGARQAQVHAVVARATAPPHADKLVPAISSPQRESTTSRSNHAG
jgi:hypothetical protein